jgi:hypothetical protein
LHAVIYDEGNSALVIFRPGHLFVSQADLIRDGITFFPGHIFLSLSLIFSISSLLKPLEAEDQRVKEEHAKWDEEYPFDVR